MTVVRSTAPGFEKAMFGEVSLHRRSGWPELSYHVVVSYVGPVLQNFGARDPTAGELASNFSDKVLGNFDTEHIIK